MASDMASSISIGKVSRFHQIDEGDPFPATFRCMRSIIVVVADVNQQSDDLLLLLDGLQEVLQDPDVVIYILAERRSLLEGWLQDCKATTVVGTPISVNITFAIETAAKRCAIEGKLLLWVCCLGRVRKVNETTVSDFMPMDGWEKAISGEDLKRLTSQMHSTCVLTVVLEVCNSGNFMDNGALVIHQPVEAAVLNGPRMICISACRNDEYAHFGNYRGLRCGAFTLILRGEIDKRRRDGRPAVYIREIGHVAAPVLGKQHPVVAVSHPIDQDTLLGFPDFN